MRILLGSRFSMWMAWGPDLTFFCNDAYRRDTLGKKYPWALGKPAREVWAEIWPEIGPRIDAVMATGTATWDEALLLFLSAAATPRRPTTRSPTARSPTTTASIAGMLCVVSEDTERVIGERRMATLRDLGADAERRPDGAPRTSVFAAAARHLGGRTDDLPFTLTYLFDEDGDTAHLAGRDRRAGRAPRWRRDALDPADEPLWPVGELGRRGVPRRPARRLRRPARPARGRSRRPQALRRPAAGARRRPALRVPRRRAQPLPAASTRATAASST